MCNFTSVWANETRKNWVFILCQSVCNVWLLAVWRLNYNDDDHDNNNNELMNENNTSNTTGKRQRFEITNTITNQHNERARN